MSMKTTIIDTGIPCNTYKCNGTIMGRICDWIEFGEPLNPMSPSHHRSEQSNYCETCGIQYEPGVVGKWLEQGRGKIEIISEDPPHVEPPEKTEKPYRELLSPEEIARNPNFVAFMEHVQENKKFYDG